MQFHIFDIISVVVIGLIAIAFITRTYLKMRKNKCATICSGCSTESCSTKSFKAKDNKKVIHLKSMT